MKHSGYTIRSPRGTLRRLLLLLPLAAVLAAAGILAYLYFSGFFYQRETVNLKTHATIPEITALAKESPTDAATMLAQVRKVLCTDAGTAPFAVSYVEIPGAINNQSGAQSEYIVSADQTKLLRAYIRLGDKDRAVELAERIDRDLVGEDGFLVTSIPAASLSLKAQYAPKPELEDITASAAPSVTATADYLSALLEAYVRWGTAKDWSRIEKYAALLYSDTGLPVEDFSIPLPTPTPLPSGFGNDNPDLVVTGTESPASLPVIRTASLDIATFDILSGIDKKFAVMYDACLPLATNSYISDTLPLFAYAYDPASKGYVYVSDQDSNVDTEEALETALHLAEAGALPAQTSLWLKEKLLNDGVLYETYQVVTGQATSDVEAYSAYGTVLRIADLTDDSVLYGATLGSLENHFATKVNSRAKAMVYRQVETSRVAVYASDNLTAVLGLANT